MLGGTRQHGYIVAFRFASSFHMFTNTHDGKGNFLKKYCGVSIDRTCSSYRSHAFLSIIGNAYFSCLINFPILFQANFMAEGGWRKWVHDSEDYRIVDFKRT